LPPGKLCIKTFKQKKARRTVPQQKSLVHHSATNTEGSQRKSAILTFPQFIREEKNGAEDKMNEFQTKRLPVQPDGLAPDGSAVRILLRLSGGSLAHFELGPGAISKAVAHRTVEEIWYFIQGCGEMWRKQKEREEVTCVTPGVCITIPSGTHFQLRSLGPGPLAAIGITMPPWPGENEACEVRGKWEPTALRQF
jgi:mannose-6-phosphate isomerase-like protein (cupin superfamily)